MRESLQKSSKLVKLAMMIAISYVLVFLIRIPFPPAPFLIYDPADVPIYITTFAFGVVPGVIITAIISFLQAFTLGGDGIYGMLMHFLATGIFVLASGLIYKKNKTRKGALMGLIVGVICMVVIMALANIVITPIFTGMPRSAIYPIIFTIIIPFNLIKGGLNALLTFLVYKKVSVILHKE